MMIIACESCGKKYKINENKLVRDLSRLKCKACGNIILVKKPESEPEEILKSELIPSPISTDPQPKPIPDYIEKLPSSPAEKPSETFKSTVDDSR